jgi:tRNA/tmRNA/rRNA uracil-C5-methylase (TrmA/RlmC/RlmD family)
VSASGPGPAPEIELTLGPAAHGGHFVARHGGRVVFVRHGLPGEVVRVRLTEYDDGARFWRGDVTEVLQASADRVAHPWDPADALLAAQRGVLPVGGAEFGHIHLDTQRNLKAGIFAEQLQRLAKVERSITVEPVPDERSDGLHWRTRAAFSVTAGGRLAMHAHRSTELIPVQHMPLAVEAINSLQLWNVDFSGFGRVEVAAPAGGGAPLVLLVPAPGPQPGAVPGAPAVAEAVPGAAVAVLDPESGSVRAVRGPTWVSEAAAGHRYRVTGEGFWQIHRSAPEVLTSAVLAGTEPRQGERVADLYAGAGLFTAPLAEAVGPAGRVHSTEGSPRASRDARRNLHGTPQARVLQGKVDRLLGTLGEVDVVVLDPPRAGAGKNVVRKIAAAGPRVVGYVSCDPASFARDAAYFAEAGWWLDLLRVFDLYPHTHHMESFALFRPAERVRARAGDGMHDNAP